MKRIFILLAAFCAAAASACAAESTQVDISVPEQSVTKSSSAAVSEQSQQTTHESEAAEDTAADTQTTADSETNIDTKTEEEMITITANGTEFKAVPADNSSAQAFLELLRQSALTVNMSDYANMEKVGDIGTSLPQNNEQMNTEPGDIILYQGSNIVIYYGTNSWSLTRIGKIADTSQEELLSALGSGDVTVTFSLG